MKPTSISMIRMTYMAKHSCQTFLPIFDDAFVWCTDVLDSFCSACPLACYPHPLVQDPKNQYSYFKLCTLSVAKIGLIDLKQLTRNKSNLTGSDYKRSVQLVKDLKFIPTRKL